MKHKYKIGDFVELCGEHLEGKVGKITGYTLDKYYVKRGGLVYNVDCSEIKRVVDTQYHPGDRVALPALPATIITFVDVGPDGEVRYQLNGVTGNFTGDVLSPAGEALSIYRNGRETIAKRFDENGNTAATSVAYCSDEDSYDLLTGAKVAIERMAYEATLPKDLRELLTPGTIGQTMDGKYFVAAGVNMVYEGGGFDYIKSLSADDLMMSDTIGIKIIYDAEFVPSFDIARRSGNNRMKWRRRGI